ncbi:MAG: SHOCT domain-containing protein [Methanosphaera stadtmanae]|nr:SHOCT domain-containing protein [Methanosphaera stadtmanae]
MRSSGGMPHPNLNITNPNKQAPRKDFSQNKYLNDEYIENNQLNGSNNINSVDIREYKEDSSKNVDFADEYVDNHEVNVSDNVKAHDVQKSLKVSSKDDDFEDTYVNNSPVDNSQDMSNSTYTMEGNPEFILDPADQIRKFYELKEDGIITQEEFDKKKKQLLDL